MSRSATIAARSACRACSPGEKPRVLRSRTVSFASDSRAVPKRPRRPRRDPRRRARDRAHERARLARRPPGVGHGAARRPGAPAQRTTRADHGADADLRKPSRTGAFEAASQERPAEAAHDQARQQDPNRLSFVGFVIGALVLVPALLIAIPVHEMGHAAAAYFLGDRSVRYFGYFTLNPRRFLDPLGVIAVFVALVGWGRKVPVQPNRISTMSQRLLHTLGGPAANLLAAIAFGLVYRALSSAGIYPGLTLSGLVAYLIYAIVFLNLSLFAFQLLPIPGLDGWDVIETIFRSRNPRFFFNV